MKTFEKIERWLYIFDEFRFDYSRCRVHVHEMNIGEDTFACVRPCDERLGQRSMARSFVVATIANVEREKRIFIDVAILL